MSFLHWIFSMVRPAIEVNVARKFTGAARSVALLTEMRSIPLGQKNVWFHVSPAFPV